MTPELRRSLARGAEELGLTLDAAALDRFEWLEAALIRWGETRNLTAIREPIGIVEKHFLDSLTCVVGCDFRIAGRTIDVGSGAGFPGIALKIAFPDLPLTLLEASIKKVEFLEHASAGLDFADVEVLRGRAEEMGRREEFREKFAVALARSVAGMAALAELCLPFVMIGGIFLAQKGEDSSSETAAARFALARLGGDEPELLPVAIPGTALRRLLIRVRKKAMTPASYPRRPGVPVRKPLSGSAGGD